MRTYCFGRFLIDLPQEAVVSGQRYEYMFGEIRSERLGGGRELFQKKMREREEALHHTDRNKAPALIETRLRTAPNMRIFRTGQIVYGEVDDGFEAYRLDKGVLFSMQETSMRAERMESILSRLETKLLPNLRYRLPDEIPSEPGFCLNEGFIADANDEFHFERAELNFRFPKWPDVSLRVFYRTNGDKLEESLLSRTTKPFPADLLDLAQRIRTLRRGKHDVGPLRGEELLQAYPTDGGFYIHHLVWDTQGSRRSLTDPAFYLQLDTGYVIGQPNPERPPSLTDDEAVRLFDAIVDSIRLRPTSPGKGAQAPASPPASGHPGRKS